VLLRRLRVCHEGARRDQLPAAGVRRSPRRRRRRKQRRRKRGRRGRGRRRRCVRVWQRRQRRCRQWCSGLDSTGFAQTQRLWNRPGCRYISQNRGRQLPGPAQRVLPCRAVQVAPIKPTLKAPGSKHLKLEHENLLSYFPFKFNLRRYALATAAQHRYAQWMVTTLRTTRSAGGHRLAPRLAGRCRLTLSSPR
jgi:hypothetical protein